MIFIFLGVLCCVYEGWTFKTLKLERALIRFDGLNKCQTYLSLDTGKSSCGPSEFSSWHAASKYTTSNLWSIAAKVDKSWILRSWLHQQGWSMWPCKSPGGPTKAEMCQGIHRFEVCWLVLLKTKHWNETLFTRPRAGVRLLHGGLEHHENDDMISDEETLAESAWTLDAIWQLLEILRHGLLDQISHSHRGHKNEEIQKDPTDLPVDLFCTLRSRKLSNYAKSRIKMMQIADKVRISIWNDEVMHWISQQINLHGVISQALQQTLWFLSKLWEWELSTCWYLISVLKKIKDHWNVTDLNVINKRFMTLQNCSLSSNKKLPLESS